MSKTPLEKLVTSIRLGWHGVTVAAVGSAAAYLCDLTADTEALVRIIPLGLAISFYADSFKAFRRTSNHIKEHGYIDERFVKPQLLWYCTRQGVRTAAANYGLTKEFDTILENYHERKLLTFIPHV